MCLIYDVTRDTNVVYADTNKNWILNNFYVGDNMIFVVGSINVNGVPTGFRLLDLNTVETEDVSKAALYTSIAHNKRKVENVVVDKKAKSLRVVNSTPLGVIEQQKLGDSDTENITDNVAVVLARVVEDSTDNTIGYLIANTEAGFAAYTLSELAEMYATSNFKYAGVRVDNGVFTVKTETPLPVLQYSDAQEYMDFDEDTDGVVEPQYEGPVVSDDNVEDITDIELDDFETDDFETDDFISETLEDDITEDTFVDDTAFEVDDFETDTMGSDDSTINSVDDFMVDTDDTFVEDVDKFEDNDLNDDSMSLENNMTNSGELESNTMSAEDIETVLDATLDTDTDMLDEVITEFVEDELVEDELVEDVTDANDTDIDTETVDLDLDFSDDDIMDDLENSANLSVQNNSIIAEAPSVTQEFNSVITGTDTVDKVVTADTVNTRENEIFADSSVAFSLDTIEEERNTDVLSVDMIDADYEDLLDKWKITCRVDGELTTAVFAADDTALLEEWLKVPGITVTGEKLVREITEDTLIESADLVHISIPNTVTTVGANVFAYCTALETVTMQADNVCIEQNAFVGCDVLNTVKTNGVVEYVQQYAFADCSSLTVFDVAEVLWIGQGAFINCCQFDATELLQKSVNLSYIASLAFVNTATKTVVLGTNVKEMGAMAFAYNANLEQVVLNKNIVVTWGSTLKKIQGADLTDVDFVDEHQLHTFKGCTNLSKINFMAKDIVRLADAYLSETALVNVD